LIDRRYLSVVLDIRQFRAADPDTHLVARVEFRVAESEQAAQTFDTKFHEIKRGRR
jgi:hypothetical protein